MEWWVWAAAAIHIDIVVLSLRCFDPFVRLHSQSTWDRAARVPKMGWAWLRNNDLVDAAAPHLQALAFSTCSDRLSRGCTNLLQWLT